MSTHPTQSLVCADCQSLFRTARALKIHQQRHQTTSNVVNQPNYNFISSYLVVAFSSPKFALIVEKASLQRHFPLGEFSSQFYRCSICQISFPCSRSLNSHRISQHERDDREISKKLLDEILDEIERFSPLIDDEIQLNFIQQASHFGLKRKNSNEEIRRLKNVDDRRIYPKCFHAGRTCANLCSNYLISSEDFIRNYSFKIVGQTKGNPFSQGSIVSQPSNVTKDSLNNEIAKRRPIKRTQSSLTEISQSKRRQTIESNLSRSASSIVLPSKRQRSPTIPYLSPKRRRQQRKKLDDDVEQENDVKPKQRQASSGSIEYVQVLNNDGQSSPSLNNIENKSEDDEEIVHCRSSKTSIQNFDPDEKIRVRCKVCGEIIEGRSRFSKHVLTMHSHLLGKTIPGATQQTTTVR